MNLDDLKKSFDEELFLRINGQLIDSKFTTAQLSISPDSSKFITNTRYYGNYDDLDLHILTVEHSGTEDARVGVSLDIFKLMKKYSLQNALVAAYSKSSENWRYSLITSNLTVNDKGKVTKEFSNPRRYSFVLGPNQKVLTPYKQLVQSGSVDDIASLTKRFSLEVVNNEFYKEIAKLYDELVGTDKVEKCLKYPSGGDQAHEFAVRLIGRIIFCWFLREKKSTNNIPLIPSDVLSGQAANAENNYYHNTLAPLFFEVLNKPFENRTSKFKQNGYSKIPYLNGGLFSNDDIDHYKFDSSLEVSVGGLVDVPDAWLRKLFELLERYNFTVDENTSFDTDLSIDPEMLGRVFENLLARINPETGETVRKSTGSFYTPREIVDYMVDSSLVEYLSTKTAVPREKLDALVSYDLVDDVNNELDQHESQTVLEALSTLTVLDPACGSGAFPIGMLQKIVHVISILDPDAKWWLAKQLENATPELRKDFENKGVDYIRKLGIIRQTIYGVDIQPIATEISRLRCFLTLVVDEAIDDNEENRGIKPLPNLEFKFVTANSLIRPPSEDNISGNVTLFEDFGSKLTSKVKEYFYSHGPEKVTLLHQIRDLIDEKVDQNTSFVLNNYGILKDDRFADEFNRKNESRNTMLLKEAETWKSYKNIFRHKPVDFFETKYFFPDVEEGFDIVIGNPPYIQLQKDGGKLADTYKDQGYETFSRSGDIYTLFFEQGVNFLSKGSHLCYITSNKWMRTSYGLKLREYFLKQNPIKLIDFAGFQVFDTAAVDTTIVLLQKAENSNSLQAVHFKNDYKSGDDIGGYFKNNTNLLSDLTPGTWFIGDSVAIDLKNKIEEIGLKLSKWDDLAINYGIKTGANDVFIVDQDFKDNIIKKEPRSSDCIKPLLRGLHTNRFKVDWSNDYILYIPWHFPLSASNLKGSSKKAEQAFSDNHPILYEYFIKNKDRLLQRNKAETGIRYEWYALQRSGSSYMDDFKKPKVVWMNMNRGWKFAYSEAGYYVDMTLNFLASEKYSKVMTGILSSNVHKWYFLQTGRIFDNGGFMTKVDSVSNFPVPKKTDNNKELFEEIESIVDAIVNSELSDDLEDRVNKLVYKLYDLNPEEIAIIEESVK